MGEDTIWVDVKNEGTAETSENSIMLKLDMEGNGNSNAVLSEARGRVINTTVQTVLHAKYLILV